MSDVPLVALETRVIRDPEPGREAALPADLQSRIAAWQRNSKAPATWNAYESDWKDFSQWCAEHERSALPADPDTLRGYLADRATTLATSTLQRRMAAIAQLHEAARLDSPTRSLAVRELMKGILRDKGRRAQNAKKPVRLQELGEMVCSLPETAIGIRDRALLLAGFLGAFRRSELVALRWEDMDWRDEGIAVHIGRSKTDPEGVGLVKGLRPAKDRPELCPVAALRAWRQLLRRYHFEPVGPVFRQVGRRGKPTALPLSDKAVARAVKQWLGRAMKEDRLELREVEAFSAHSLRAGFCTAAAEKGAEERAIAAQTGHRSLTILRRYIRDGNVLQNDALVKLGF